MAEAIIRAETPAIPLDQNGFSELLGMVQCAYDHLPEREAATSRTALDTVLRVITEHRERMESSPPTLKDSRGELRREASSLSAVLHYCTQSASVLREIRGWASGDPALAAKLRGYGIAYNEPCMDADEYEEGLNHLFYRLRSCIDVLGAT